MITRRQVMACAGTLGLSAVAAAAAWEASAQRGPSISARSERQPRPVRYGACVYTGELFDDPVYRAFYARHCEVIVPGYFLKWESVQPRRGEFDWSNADRSVALGDALNCAVRGHTLVWHASMPTWALQIANAADAERHLVAHIEAIVSRYKGRITSWDVVNEPLEDNATTVGEYRRSMWYRNLGERYLEIAFRTAAAVDPSCQLVLNEFGIETATPSDRGKRQAFKVVVQRLRDKGVPLHAVGIQGHIQAEQAIDREGLAAFVRDVKAMGLDVLVTELDMLDNNLPGDQAVRDIICAGRTYDLLDAVFSAARPLDVITWGLSDRHNWLGMWHKRADGLPNRPLPFDVDLQPKPMWHVIEHFRRSMK